MSFVANAIVPVRQQRTSDFSNLHYFVDVVCHCTFCVVLQRVHESKFYHRDPASPSQKKTRMFA